MDESIKKEALEYHRKWPAGKLKVDSSKPVANQRDLTLAYSPGVAAPCLEISKNPSMAHEYTGRGNLVAVVSNGTAVLGLGAIGPLAAKPVMEGKAVLFKKFSGIDVFDIELDERDPEKLVEIIASLEPTFGGINLEDIKAPECFEVEQQLKKRMKIPVFHDDQHGTAIVTAAAVVNALKLVNKKLEDIIVCVSGAGAAAIACLDLLIMMGLDCSNVTVCDSKGVIYKGRPDNPDGRKADFAIETSAREIKDVVKGCDLFLGLSKAGILSPEMVGTMADRPIILALANPDPEILPEQAKKVRPDCIIATGRSDYPNQVNNVLCFPYVFRGALDVGATCINDEMKMACVRAIAELATQDSTGVVGEACDSPLYEFGTDYIIPKPFDPRLITHVAPAVARAAIASGVAQRPVDCLDAYESRLDNLIHHHSLPMDRVICLATERYRRVLFTEGEKIRVLRAVQAIVDCKLAQPKLVGDINRINQLVKENHFHLDLDKDVEVIAPDKCLQEAGTIREFALQTLQSGATDLVIGGPDDTLIESVHAIDRLIGRHSDHNHLAMMHAVVTTNKTLFIVDTRLNDVPDAKALAESALLAAESVRVIGQRARVAIIENCLHSQVAPIDYQSVIMEIRERSPWIEVDSFKQPDLPLNESARREFRPDSVFTGDANILVMPDVSSANITLGLLKSLTGGVVLGPFLLGARMPVQWLDQFVSSHAIFNIVALAASSNR